MAVEDLNYFTEVDPNNHLSIVAYYTAWFQAINNEENAYFYSEAWNGALSGSFEFDFQFNITSTQPNGTVFLLSFTNDLGDAYYNILNGDLLGVSVFQNPDGGDLEVRLHEYYNSNESSTSDTYVISTGTDYYCTIKRDESLGWGTLYLYIYSDNLRTTLLDTLIVNLHNRVNFHYLYLSQSLNISQNGTPITGTCGYLERISTSVGEDFPAIKTINETSIASIKSINGVESIDTNIKSINEIT